MAPIIENSGKLEFEFGGKASVIDLKNVEDALRQLTRIVATLDYRVRQLEKR
jgi:hypothetical protein